MDNFHVNSSFYEVEGDQNEDVQNNFSQSILDIKKDIEVIRSVTINFEGDKEKKISIQNLDDVQKQKNSLKELANEINQQTYQIEQVKIDYEGQFLKRSPHKLQGNRYYYCTLEKRVFKYYTLINKMQPLGILDFDTQEYDFQVKMDKKKRLKSFMYSTKTLLIQVEDRNDEKNLLWVELIENYLRFAIGRKRHLQALSLSHRFWRHNRISDNEVLNNAQTGDLLIFRSKGVLASLQRSITGSDYDHIIMFLRYPNNELMLLESSNQYGVIQFNYMKFVAVRTFTLYEKIIYKKLERIQSETRKKLLELAVSQIGKGYSVSPMKFLRKSQRQNFFCSELIAYLYQCIEILEKSTKACTFLPGHFTDEKHQMKILKQAVLSEDLLIDYYNY